MTGKICDTVLLIILLYSFGNRYDHDVRIPFVMAGRSFFLFFFFLLLLVVVVTKLYSRFIFLIQCLSTGPGISSVKFDYVGSNVDLAPTFLGLAGVDTLATNMDGRSIVPLLVDAFNPNVAQARVLSFFYFVPSLVPIVIFSRNMAYTNLMV